MLKSQKVAKPPICTTKNIAILPTKLIKSRTCSTHKPFYIKQSLYSSQGRHNSRENGQQYRSQKEIPLKGKSHSNSNYRNQDYIDPRDSKKYNNKMSNNFEKNKIYDNPSLFGITYGVDSGRSYSSTFRPKWITDLTTSLTETPADIFDPNLQFPQFDLELTKQRSHPIFKINMEYSPEITIPFDPTAKIKFTPTKSQKPNIALLVSYRGTGYQGLQIQFEGNSIKKSVKTIEGEIVTALHRAGYINETNAQDPTKVKWSRAARTDKGVHAASNLLSAKLGISYPEQIPEAALVKKKALRYASQRYNTLFPAFISTISNMLNDPAINSQLTLIEGDNIDSAIKFQDPQSQVDPITGKHLHPNLPTNDDMIPRLLTTNKAELANFFQDHVQVNIYGNITVSPSFKYTLKRFGLITADHENMGMDKLINKITINCEEKGGLVHKFTPWEFRLLHLVAQLDREWIDDDKDDDDDDESTKKKEKEAKKEECDDDDEIPVDSTPLRDAKGNSLSKRQRQLSERRQQDLANPRAKTVQYLQYVKQYGWDEGAISELSNPDYFSDCIQANLRKYLPKQFHLTRAIKVAGSFDPKLQASTRTYEYIVPSFAFMPLSEYPRDVYDKMLNTIAPPKDTSQESEEDQQKQQQQLQTDTIKNTPTADSAVQGSRSNRKNKADTNEHEDEVEVEAEVIQTQGTNWNNPLVGVNLQPPKEMLNYRLSPQNLVDIQYTLSYYLGTRSHHNFTQGKSHKDQSARRHIRSFKPIGVFTFDDVEFVHLCVHGDSFLLHQIRKMVGFSMSLVRGNFNDVPRQVEHPLTRDQRYEEPFAAALAVAEQFANKTNESIDIASFKPSPALVELCDAAFAHVFAPKRYNIPPAPALGLLLDHVHYDGHDTRLGSEIPSNAKRGLSHVRETIFASFIRAMPLLGQIKTKEIYPEIAIQELSTSSAWRWLHLLNTLTFTTTQLGEDGLALNAKTAYVNQDIIQANKKLKTVNIVDVHGSTGTNAEIQYVQLASSTAAIPSFKTDVANKTDFDENALLNDEKKRKNTFQ